MTRRWLLGFVALFLIVVPAWAQIETRVVDIPTRPGVTQRLLVLTPPQPRAAVVILAGGHGGLQLFPNGSMRWGDTNFLVRTRHLFAEQGVLVAVLDAPSDRQRSPFLAEFRQTPEHVTDLKAVMAWLRGQARVPVWLVGTSRGTQSAAYVASELTGPEGPDGIVLTSSILSDDKTRAVTAMPLNRIRVPVLVVHHEQDGCRLCAFADMPKLMAGVAQARASHLLAFAGGVSQGDPCGPMAHHGFNGIEPEVVQQVVAWMLSR